MDLKHLTKCILQFATATCAMAVGCGSAHGPRHHSGPPAKPPKVLEPCSEAWAAVAGPEAVQDVWTYSVDRSPEFVSWLLAVAWEESHFDPLAKSSAGAVGLLQVTPQGAAEAALACNLPTLASPGQLNEMLSSKRSIVYGSCLLKKYLTESHGNWAAALTLYNGGYRQLANFLGQGRMAAETQDYVRDIFYMRYSCGPVGPGRSK